jgi:hypothetical protein
VIRCGRVSQGGKRAVCGGRRLEPGGWGPRDRRRQALRPCRAPWPRSMLAGEPRAWHGHSQAARRPSRRSPAHGPTDRAAPLPAGASLAAAS